MGSTAVRQPARQGDGGRYVHHCTCTSKGEFTLSERERESEKSSRNKQKDQRTDDKHQKIEEFFTFASTFARRERALRVHLHRKIVFQKKETDVIFVFAFAQCK